MINMVNQSIFIITFSNVIVTVFENSLFIAIGVWNRLRHKWLENSLKVVPNL